MTQNYIPLSAGRVSFTPPALETESPENDPVIVLREPTPEEGDLLGYEAYRRGVIPIGQETFRATLIDEIFVLYGDEKGEEHANTLESVWQFEKQHQNEIDLWYELERERIRDERGGAPKREKAPFPVNPCPVRARSKNQLLIDEVTMKSQRMRDLSVAQNSFDSRHERLVLQLYIVDWSNLKTPIERIDGDPHGALTEDCLAALKAEIGKKAMRQIETHLNDLFGLSKEEEKNSDLPAESGREETGSLAQSDASASSDGSLTTSPITPTPAGESDQTTGE